MNPASQEANYLHGAAGVRRRDDLLVVNVAGDDRQAWLNGQLTHDVRNATPGAGVYALAVNVRGKIMADVWVLDRRDQLAVVLPASARDVVLASFEQQIIMEDVTLTPAPELAVVSVQGPRAAELFADSGIEQHRCDELGTGGVFALIDRNRLEGEWPRWVEAARNIGGGMVSEAGYELARLRAARPRFGADFSDQHYPQEAGLIARAVSFNKGCYLGQEVVCTLENRGRTSRRLVALFTPGRPDLSAGASLLDAQGQTIGQLTSICFDAEHDGTLALGYVKAAQAAVGTRLLAGSTSLEVRTVVGES